MAPITLSHVVKRYSDGTTAVDDVSLDIADGEFMIRVGPSGCGKSTLLRMIVGLEDVTSGEVRIGDERVNELAPRDRNLAMVFQNYALYPHLTVFENIAFPLRLRKGRLEAEIRATVERVAAFLELTEHLERKPSQLSGGQRQRVAIARAIILRPSLIVADEPTSALDVSVQAQILNLFKQTKRELGLTYLFVSHNLGVIRYISDRVAVMRLGQIVEVGCAHDIFTNPQHAYTQALLAAVPDLDVTRDEVE